MTFGLLWAVFPPNSHVVLTDEISGEKQAFKLKSTSYHMSRDGLVFELSGTKILWNGDRYARTWVNTQISKFKGIRKPASLPAHPLGEKQREELTARGRTYTSLAGVQFLNYSGVLIQVRKLLKLGVRSLADLSVQTGDRLWHGPADRQAARRGPSSDRHQVVPPHEPFEAAEHVG